VLSSVTAPPPVRPPDAAPVPHAASAEPEARRPERWWRRIDWWRVAPVLVSAVLAAVYLITGPRSPDLAAHVFRSDLFGREGFTIWNGQWYGGHHTPAYSVLSPPLGWLLGPQLMGAIAAVAATALFEPLLRGHFGDRASRFGALWFGVGSATLLFTNRLPFALGVAFGVAALLALQRRRRLLAPLLAVLCAISSPVAGLFLGMCGVAYALASRGQAAAGERRAGGILAIAALGPPVLLSLAFPEGGWAPFPFTAYVPIPLFALACLIVLPRRERALRIGAVLYALGATAALVIPTAMGGNAVRLGALVGGPVLACALHGRWRRPVVPMAALLAALGFWQWSPAVRDIYKAIDDPVADAAYFEQLREWLRLLPDQRRVEIPFTYGHWEGAEVASDAKLARGWLRQLDTGRNEIFYDKGALNELTYASWLTENAVRYVALPDAKPDSSSYRERALIERGLPYLKLRYRTDHWRVYEVTLPTPVVIPQGGANMTLEQFGSDSVLLRVIRPGDALVRVRWTPYWLAHGGCVERDGEWTKVTAFREGFLRLTVRFSPERVLFRGRRCNETG
jgi:hypothetical protein